MIFDFVCMGVARVYNEPVIIRLGAIYFTRIGGN